MSDTPEVKIEKVNLKREPEIEVIKEYKHFRGNLNTFTPKDLIKKDADPAGKKNKPENEKRCNCGKHAKEIEILTVKLIQEQKKSEWEREDHQERITLLVQQSLRQSDQIRELEQKLKKKEADYIRKVHHLKSILSRRSEVMSKLLLPEKKKIKNSLLDELLLLEKELEALTNSCERNPDPFFTTSSAPAMTRVRQETEVISLLEWVNKTTKQRFTSNVGGQQHIAFAGYVGPPVELD